MASLNCYITFNGNCKEAMMFYHQCLGGNLEMRFLRDSPMGINFPESMGDFILHSSLKNGSMALLGTDIAEFGDFSKGSAVSIFVNCHSETEAHEIFNKLMAESIRYEPLSQTFWGDWYASVTDKFGISWMLFCEKTT